MTLCTNIAILQDNIFEEQEVFEFQIAVSFKSNSTDTMVVVSLNRTVVVINELPMVLAPSVVNVSEGIPAVVCFTAMFTSPGSGPVVSLSLATNDITACESHSTLPDVWLLHAHKRYISVCVCVWCVCSMCGVLYVV